MKCPNCGSMEIETVYALDPVWGESRPHHKRCKNCKRVVSGEGFIEE